MTPTELADELERIAPHLHTLGVAEACAIEAAQTLRALEEVRVAAADVDAYFYDDPRGGLDVLHEALARVGGG